MGSSRQAQNLLSEIEVFNEDPVRWVQSLRAMSARHFCESLIHEKTRTLAGLEFETLDRDKIRSVGAEWLKASFELRLHLNRALGELSETSRIDLISFFRNLRQVEDYIAELASTEPDRNAFDLDFKKMKPPLLEPQACSPCQVDPRYRSPPRFQFKPGDVLVTRGISFMSATISQITDDRTHFSHGVFVHETPAGEIQTIESYLQKGVEFYSLEEALKNENVRILVFRALDEDLAKKASDLMGKRVRDLKAQGQTIPYDYEMDHEDHSRMTCGEVIIAAYKWASQGTFVVPSLSAGIRLKKPEILKKLNLVVRETFSPVLMEVDPRFQLILDWRDVSLLRDQRQKDGILQKIFEWIELRDYHLKETLATRFLKAFWATRSNRFWQILAKPFDLSDVPLDTPETFLVTVAQIRKVGHRLLEEVKKADKLYQARQGFPMSERRIAEFLEELRERDFALFQQGRANVFHHLLGPNRTV
ncbi:MAG: hypothetical protein ACK5Y2_05470 [Bdellovibrionales bacterium]